MLMACDERRHVARLLGFIVEGERLAHDGARSQAVLSADTGMHRFLINQARQEAMHTRVLQAAVLCLRPRGFRQQDRSKPMRRYRLRLEDAVARGDLNEALLAQQVILEGFGDAILTSISNGVESRRLGFRRLRQVIIGQEQAHHAFGVRRLEQAVKENPETCELLRERGACYLSLVDEMLDDLADLLTFFDEDPDDYARAARQGIPACLIPIAADGDRLGTCLGVP